MIPIHDNLNEPIIFTDRYITHDSLNQIQPSGKSKRRERRAKQRKAK